MILYLMQTSGIIITCTSHLYTSPSLLPDRYHQFMILNICGIFSMTIDLLFSAAIRAASASISSCFLKWAISSGWVRSSSLVFSSWYLCLLASYPDPKPPNSTNLCPSMFSRRGKTHFSQWCISYSYSSSPWCPGPIPKSGSFPPVATNANHSSCATRPSLSRSNRLSTWWTASLLRSGAMSLVLSSLKPYVECTSEKSQYPLLSKSCN